MQPISNYTKHRMKSRRHSKEHFIRRDGAAADLHDFFGTGLSARQNDQLRLAVKASKSSIFDVSAVKVSCFLYEKMLCKPLSILLRRMLMTIGRLKPFDNFYAVYFVCHLCKQASALSTQNGIFDHLVQHSLHTSERCRPHVYSSGRQEFHSVVFLTTISFALFLKFISQFSGYYDPSSSETSVAWCLLPWCMLSQPYRAVIWATPEGPLREA
ncbi:6-bisphosphatase class,Fructose-1 [Trichinella spiralis]|uniref:6-bisphosphatase class,Fructose-1 n=1 Tax=Trichinella spiralis TaxID=6334 RepID=A0ABR3KBD7_TRISP